MQENHLGKSSPPSEQRHQNIPAHETKNKPDATETAAYVADLLIELRGLVAHARLALLEHLLNLAAEEARFQRGHSE